MITATASLSSAFHGYCQLDLAEEVLVFPVQILKPMMLRRLKEDVEKSIAPKEETIVEVHHSFLSPS